MAKKLLTFELNNIKNSSSNLQKSIDVAVMINVYWSHNTHSAFKINKIVKRKNNIDMLLIT